MNGEGKKTGRKVHRRNVKSTYFWKAEKVKVFIAYTANFTRRPRTLYGVFWDRARLCFRKILYGAKKVPKKTLYVRK